ncbi:UDP-2,3-diacylglucosamine diphosphatase LpxI [uncultured Hyphomicrobium sp.]|uniref:UDP-2,3-diacylglucosamine diphosphatase LpxI domain-containing protein n=1 Tax=uncultured Hyphomicrobium sp. TaxID=194373 RepID=UPI0025E2B40F|nr:UDP-2,3-diacylglucosamine diphosphatase LpxI [uncultured Hyphomicrobium sp.]
MGATERRLGILAGGGVLPREIADSAASRGIPVSIVAIDGEANADFAPHPVTVVNWGQIGAMIRALKEARTTHLVIVGHVHRPELKGLRPDLGLFRYLPKILRIVAAGGDDGVLRRVVRFFEQQGLKVIAPGEAAPELVIGAGPMGKAQASPGDRADIAKGLELVRALGRYDIGQSVIVAGGRIEAIEGAEGTDRMIARAAARRAGTREGRAGGALVKRSKPGQDMRIDLPTIGPATVEGARAAGLAGIAVEAGRVLVADRTRTLAAAEAANVFIEGVTDGAVGESQLRFDPRKVAIPFRMIGRSSPGGHVLHDAVKAIATLDALAPFGSGDAVVVVRNHVLAVEAGGEGAGATLERAAGLRQWASLTHNRRGVVGLARVQDLTMAFLQAVASAGYAGIAVAEPEGADGALAKDIVEAADRIGIVVLRRVSAAGTAS